MMLKHGCLPLLDCYSVPQIIEVLYDTIVSEATAIEFYGRLLMEAPNELNQLFITEARDEEMVHLEKFTMLYCHYTSRMPQYIITPVVYPNYKSGILMALKDESEAADFYRNVQLSTTDILVRDTYYYAMVDELRHATLFSTLYNSL